MRMAKRTRGTHTKLDILRLATTGFLENGYSSTTVHKLCKELGISPGNFTFHFPTKECLLADLVKLLCQFQWKLMEEEANEGFSSVMAVCLELATMASACEQDPILKDFFLSSYTSPMCLDIIRRNDAERAEKVFAAYCSEWTREQFVAAEILCSGIEYATLMTAGEPVPLETRVAGALNNILGIYGIPQEIRRTKIQRVFELDYRKLGRETSKNFRDFVQNSDDRTFLDLLNRQEI